MLLAARVQALEAALRNLLPLVNRGLYGRAVAAAESALATPTPPAAAATDALADLVAHFSAALLDKLRAAEAKYGWSDAWTDPANVNGMRADLLRHVGKGDPRDVAAYCAFLWHHGASTAAAATDGARRWTRCPRCDHHYTGTAHVCAALAAPPAPAEAGGGGRAMIDRAITLELPEPPTINRMLDLAKKRTRRGPGGVWMQKAQTRYWVEQQEYQQAVQVAVTHALIGARRQGAHFHGESWTRWRIVRAHFRVHNERDWPELLAGLKWPIDALVQSGLVVDDSPRELDPPPPPTQEVDRKRRGVTLTVAPVED